MFKYEKPNQTNSGQINQQSSPSHHDSSNTAADYVTEQAIAKRFKQMQSTLFNQNQLCKNRTYTDNLLNLSVDTLMVTTYS